MSTACCLVMSSTNERPTSQRVLRCHNEDMNDSGPITAEASDKGRTRFLCYVLISNLSSDVMLCSLSSYSNNQ
jgi:hypothetical protein